MYSRIVCAVSVMLLCLILYEVLFLFNTLSCKAWIECVVERPGGVCVGTGHDLACVR